MTDIDIHAMLLRAEAKALKRLEEHRPKTAMNLYEETLQYFEEQYATACAVRRHWEDASAKMNSSP